MKKAKLTKIVALVLAILMVMGVFLSLPVFAAAGDPPYITSIKVCKPGTTEELVSVDANTAFDLIIGIKDEGGVNATANAPVVRLDTTAFSIGAVSDILVHDITATSYNVTFKNIKYLGGGTPNFSFSISYSGSAVPMVSLSTTLNMCKEPVIEVEPSPTPTPTPVPAKAPTLAPKAVSASSTQVNPNVPFSVSANTTNTSSTQIIENVTATVTMDTQLKLSSGSNTIYVGNLAAGASTKATFNLSAANTAEPGSYKATITFSGTWEGEPVTCSQEIAVSVVQPERFEISRTEFTDTIFMGEEASMTVYYVNKGKGIIYNLSAEIKGENIANPGQQQFIGNVAAGTENSLEFYINAEQVGALNGTIVLTYEDADGNIKTLEKEFAASVEENEFNNGGGMFPPDIGIEEIPMEPQAGMPIWAWILIAVGVAGAVAVVVVIVVKKRKQKKLAQELEEDDEDI